MRASHLLLLCGAIFVFGETLLSPFYPQFFARVFGVVDWQMTGEYIALCRFTLLLAVPIWGWLAGRYDPLRLLMLGQALAGICCLFFPLVQNLTQFLVLSVFLLVFKGSYFLFYSLFVLERGALAGVRQVQQVIHLAMIAATVASLGVLHLAEPLRLFWVAALLDALLVLCCWHVRGLRCQARAEPQAPTMAWSRAHLYAYAVLVLTLAFALNVTRPYLTSFVHSYSDQAWCMALLYLAPSAVALFLLPYLDRVQYLGRSTTYSLAVLILGVSLVMQMLATDLWVFLLGRLLFGGGAVAAQAVLEWHLFARHSEAPHAPLSLTSSVQHAGQLLAPLLAAWGVSHWGLPAPFWLALIGLLLSVGIIRPALGHTPSLPILRSHP